jgi:hypothetical protein
MVVSANASKSVKINLKLIINRGVFCGQIPLALKKIINVTRRRFFMRSFYFVMALLENIVIMVIIDFQCFTEEANDILGERLNGTLGKLAPSISKTAFNLNDPGLTQRLLAQSPNFW